MVSREREALVGQLRQTGDDLVRTVLDALPGLVGEILLYLVLALAVLIGGPFALGFWLGGVRQRAKGAQSGKTGDFLYLCNPNSNLWQEWQGKKRIIP